MKILYFTRDYNVHDQRFLSALAESGYQVSFLHLEPPPVSGLSRSNHVDIPGDRAVALPGNVAYIPWLGGKQPSEKSDQKRLVDDLKRVIAELQPDIIQAGPLHLCAYLVALTGFHSLLSMSWGYDLLYDAPRCTEIQEKIRFTLQHSTAMLGDCDTIRQLAMAYGMPDKRIVTFPWGVDLERFQPAYLRSPVSPIRINHPDNQPSDKPFILLSTRNWEPIYGVELIAKAFVLAAQQFPELRLVMLGGGSLEPQLLKIFQREGHFFQAEEVGNASEQLSGENNLFTGTPDILERVYFPGSQHQDALVDYYRSADLYLSASHSDGSSISLLEAMACAKPVLVSDIPGNREWVTPGVHGWWFPDGDYQALAEAIIHAVQNRGRLEEMGRSARRLVEQRANWQQNFPQLFRAYEIALQPKEALLRPSVESNTNNHPGDF